MAELSNSAGVVGVGVGEQQQDEATAAAAADASASIPQWKRDLIQRRKSNISRTIGANQAVTHSKQDSEQPIRPLRESPSATKLASKINSSFNRSSSQTMPVAAAAVGNGYGNGIGLGVGVGIDSGGHYTQSTHTQVRVNSEEHMGDGEERDGEREYTEEEADKSDETSKTGCAVAVAAAAAETETENGTCVSAASVSASACKITTKTGNSLSASAAGHTHTAKSQQMPQKPLSLQSEIHSCHEKQNDSSASSTAVSVSVPIQNNSSSNQKICNNHQKFVKNPNSSKKTCSNKKFCNSQSQQTTTTNTNANHNAAAKMVAVQEMNDSVTKEFDFDQSEELQYGPGIVSKLRCRYLSLTLRQTTGKTRLPMDSLRRATSLNNLLDGGADDLDEEEEEDDEEADAVGAADENGVTVTAKRHTSSSAGTNNRYSYSNTTADYTKYRTAANKTEEIVQNNWKVTDNENQPRSARQIKRGNDSLKRARSVEALLCDKTPWGTATDVVKLDLNLSKLNLSDSTNISPGSNITIEDKISSARERTLPTAPKRLTSIIDDTERPPPDLVKQTLKMFEANANRRGGRGQSKRAGGEVATKIANYKSIISQEKSPKKIVVKPANLDVRQKPTLINPSSPISSIAKKFVGGDESAPSSNSTSTPVQSYNRSSSIEMAFRQQKNELTPIRSGGGSGAATPDIIPRKHLDKQGAFLSALNANKQCDSPVTELSKKIGDLCLDSPAASSVPPADPTEPDALDGSLIKRVSKLALENIAKAGTTQHFSFKDSAASPQPKQIGVIRPLVAEPKLQPAKEANEKGDKIEKPEVTTPDKSLIISSLNAGAATTTATANHKMALTSREIEKNLINEKKNEQASLDTAGGTASPVSWVAAGQKKKSRAPPAAVVENNTMVFNFKDRKEVPDYIENDGLVFKKRRELPKPNESGFVILDNLSLETSTDNDDYWTMGPPSPCDVEFENANIVINGKSSIRNRHPKDSHLRVKFNETLTSTFEYPSETSILEEYTSDNSCNESMDALDMSSNPNSHSHVAVDEVIQLPTLPNMQNTSSMSNTTRMLGNLSLGSTSLGSYVPLKAQINNKFELGVTRNDTQPTSAEELTADQQALQQQLDESIQYLKPASDDHTVAYSEGIQKTDILF